MANVCFEPCGHTTVCIQCEDRVRKCPVCRVSHRLIMLVVKVVLVRVGNFL